MHLVSSFRSYDYSELWDVTIKLVGLTSLRMPNCSIETKQKVVSLYYKGYSLFSFSKATSVPKSTCWDIVWRYNSCGHVRNRKSPDRPKNMDSKVEKQLINLSQNDPEKNSTQLSWHINPKKCSTSLIRRILIYHLRAWTAIKKPYLTAKNQLDRKVWQLTTLYFPKFSGKMCCFRTKQLWNCTLTNEY